MVISLDLDPHGNYVWALLSLGLFGPTTMDFRAHVYRQPSTGFSRNRIWILLELALDNSAHHHHIWDLYAMGLLPPQTLANQ